MELVYLFIGLAIGAVSAWVIASLKLKSSAKIVEEKLSFISKEAEKQKADLHQKDNSILDLSRKLSAKESDFQHLTSKIAEQKADLEKLQEKFSIEFKNLANEILDEKTKKFTQQNKENLDLLLKPLGERIKEFEKKVEETYDKEAQQRFSLKEEVKRLAELNQVVSQEASNLTKALKGETKTQGNWGEVILESILEKSGLQRDREYFVQKSFENEEGKKFQPDVVIIYPGERSIVVDSKVSLNAYEKYVGASTQEEMEQAVKEHLLSVKRHIEELSQKGYHMLNELRSLDFVMMFMPVEPAYLLAIQSEPGLWNYAYDKRILLISPTNLIAALKMVESMWRQEFQNKNAEEIARQSGALYDKFEGLLSDLIELGKRLNATQDFYKSSMNKLTDGKGSLIARVENIRKLGAKTKKTLPQSLVNRTDFSEETDD